MSGVPMWPLLLSITFHLWNGKRPPLKARAAGGELVYLPLDTHLSSRSHAIVGEAIVQALLDSDNR